MSNVKLFEVPGNAPEGKEKEVVNQILYLCKMGCNNIDDFQETVFTDISYVLASLKLVLDNYDTAYQVSNFAQQNELKGLDLDALKTQVSLLEEWFAIEKKFYLSNITPEDVLEQYDYNLNFKNFTKLYNTTITKYNESLDKLKKCIDTNEEINTAINQMLAANYPKTNGSYEVTFANSKDAQTFANFIEKRDDITTAISNYDAAYETITQKDALIKDSEIFQDEDSNTVIKIDFGDDGLENS